MKKQFIRLTSGWIPVSVLVLFTAALVAGQARANLPNDIQAAPVTAAAHSVSIIISSDLLAQLEALPLVVDTLLTLPLDAEVSRDGGINSPLRSLDYSPLFYSRPKSK